MLNFFKIYLLDKTSGICFNEKNYPAAAFQQQNEQAAGIPAQINSCLISCNPGFGQKPGSW